MNPELDELKVLETRLGAEVASSAWGVLARHIFMSLCEGPEIADPARAADVVGNIIQAMVNDLGAWQTYFPSLKHVSRDAHWDEIARRPGTLDREAIAREMGVSTRQVYRALAKRRRRC